MTGWTVSLEREPPVTHLLLEGPPLNVLDLETLARLDRRLAQVQEEAPRLLILRSGVPGAFSAGVAVQDHAREQVPEMLRRFHGCLQQLQRLPCPSLAVVEGHCLGGGLELALACDWILASPGANFGQPEIRVGCFPPWAAAALPRRIGYGPALELILSGRQVTAEEARRLGIVTWIRPQEKLDEAQSEITAMLEAQSAAVVNVARQATLRGAQLPFPQALAECERLYQEELTQTQDMDEGLAAFQEKRSPEWSHK